MKNNRKTLIALIMALALLLQYSFGAGLLSVYANEEENRIKTVQTEDETQNADKAEITDETTASEDAAKQEEPTDPEETGSQGEDTAADNSNDLPGEPSGTAEDTSGKTDDASAKDRTDRKEETQEESYPAVTLSRIVNGVKITLSAPEGALPEGADLSVKNVSRQDVFDAVEQELSEEGKTMTDAVAFDVTPLDAEGNEIQPRSEVSVAFSGTDLEADSKDEISVFRVSDDADKVTEMDTDKATAGSQQFSTDHFTIYVVSVNGEPAGGTPQNPHGDGSVSRNTKDHPYYLRTGESITLGSDKEPSPSWGTDKYYNISTVDADALSQTGDRTFTNTNKYPRDVLLMIAHRYQVDLINTDVEFFYILVQRPSANITVWLKDAGSDVYEVKSTQVIYINHPYNVKLPKLPSYKVDGEKIYAFDGWYEDEACTKRADLETQGRTGDINYFARYKETKAGYAIVYDGNAEDVTFVPEYDPSEDGSSKINVTNESATRPSYRMKGWATEPGAREPEYTWTDTIDLNDPKVSGKVQDGILRLYAVWEVFAELNYEMSNEDYSRGNRLDHSYEWITDKQKNAVGATATPATGYRVKCWKDSNGNIVSTDEKFVPERVNGLYRSATYTAVFAPITYTVTFDTRGGSDIDAQTVSYNGKATKPKQDPTRSECYSFVGWYKDVSCTTPFDFNEGITKDTTVYAKWNENHAWGTTNYYWKNNDSQVTAERICSKCRNGETETVNTTSRVTVAPHCLTSGERTYTAVFANPAFETQVKKETIAAYGHNWGEVTYTWSKNGNTWSVTAKRVCRRDPHHIEAETVSAAAQVIEEATCEGRGKTKYTSASFNNPAFSGQEIIVDDIDPLGHAWGDWAETKPATELEDGEEQRICSRDSRHVDTRPIPKREHIHGDWALVPAVEAQCTTSGHDPYYICGGCKAWFAVDQTTQVSGKDILKPAKGHKAGDPEKGVETPSTCSSEGGYTLTIRCDNCKAVLSTPRISTPIDPDAHDWGEVIYKWSADNSTVTASRVCKKDPSHKETETVSTTYNDTKAATCTGTGKRTYTSEAFDNEAFHVQTKTVDTDPLGHNWGEVTYEWSDNNSTVTAERVCRRDAGHVETETVETTSTVGNEPTCETKGETLYTTKAFNNKAFKEQTRLVMDIPALGHDWSDWTTTREATETEEGLKTRTCQRSGCGTTDTMPIPPTGHTQHDLTLVPAVEASCLERGHDEYYECSGCSAWFDNNTDNKKQVSGKDILRPATGHTEGKIVKGAVTPADCGWPGGYNLTTYCAECGAVIGVEHITVPPDPDTHVWGDWVVKKPATVDEEGLEVRRCVNDPSHTEERIIPKIREFTITYDLNGGTLDGQTGTVTVKAENGSVITLPAPTRDGYTFDYWEGSRYNAGYKYTVKEDHTFKAIWKTADNSGSKDQSSDDKSGKDSKDKSSGDKSGNGSSNDSGSKGVGTGDDHHMTGWVAMMITSVVVLTALVIRRKDNLHR